MTKSFVFCYFIRKIYYNRRLHQKVKHKNDSKSEANKPPSDQILFSSSVHHPSYLINNLRKEKCKSSAIYTSALLYTLSLLNTKASSLVLLINIINIIYHHFIPSNEHQKLTYKVGPPGIFESFLSPHTSPR